MLGDFGQPKWLIQRIFGSALTHRIRKSLSEKLCIGIKFDPIKLRCAHKDAKITHQFSSLRKSPFQGHQGFPIFKELMNPQLNQMNVTSQTLQVPDLIGSKRSNIGDRIKYHGLVRIKMPLVIYNNISAIKDKFVHNNSAAASGKRWGHPRWEWAMGGGLEIWNGTHVT